MPTVVTINRCAEDLAWPARCVCCGGLDEQDIEAIVPETVPRTREPEEIMSVRVPHCIDCAGHCATGMSPTALGAIGLVLVVFGSYAAIAILRAPAPAAFACTVAIFAIVAIVDRLNKRKHMRPTCAASGPAYRFVHPCSIDVTTIRFANDDFAREFRAVNLGAAYEP